MNTEIARNVINEVAVLTELCARFQGKFDKGYRLSVTSPAEAHDLVNEIMNQQREIASLLDREALEKPMRRWGNWWETQDALDVGLMEALAGEAHKLLTACAYIEGKLGEGQASHVVHYTQFAIAGMLHPLALASFESEWEGAKVGIAVR